jgi:protein phosphatase PTC7
MRNCERLVNSGYFSPTQPAKLLAQSFREMQESKTQIIGSSTACVLMLNHADAKIYTANMGDSGFMVVRGEKVVHRSQEQQHFFNTPFQLSLPPSEMATQVLADHPDTADKYEFKVEDGDFIMLATDGVFDNLPDHLLISEITKVPKASARWPPSLSSMPSEERKEDDPACAELAVNLQQCANSIALMARQLSQDQFYLSPFSENACAAGFNMLGGKEDDITVLLAAVRLREGFNPS